jgi:putative membrane protein
MCITMTSDSTKFGGIVKVCLLFYHFTHIVLSVIIIPLVLITYVRALSQLFDQHKKLQNYISDLVIYLP